jgi:hypothetical protein
MRKRGSSSFYPMGVEYMPHLCLNYANKIVVMRSQRFFCALNYKLGSVGPTPLTLVNITDTESINLQHKRKRAIYSAHHILNYRRDTQSGRNDFLRRIRAERPSADLNGIRALPIGAHPECISVNNNKTTTLSLIRPNGTGAPLMRSISSTRQLR